MKNHNLPFDEWTQTFGSERLTGALPDRIGYHEKLFDIATEVAEFLGRQSELDARSDRLAHD